MMMIIMTVTMMMMTMTIIMMTKIIKAETWPIFRLGPADFAWE